jgi:competence protein ComEC
LLISGDGRHAGIVTDDGRLLVLRDSRSDFAREILMELAGVEAEPVPLANWPGADCSPDFCALTIERGGRHWRLLMSRTRNLVEERALAAACERADFVVADRYVPHTCRPQVLRADKRLLDSTGGLSIVLREEPEITTVASSQGDHGWWRGRGD